MPVLVEEQGRVLVLTLSAPERGNAVDREMLGSLEEAQLAEGHGEGRGALAALDPPGPLVGEGTHLVGIDEPARDRELGEPPVGVLAESRHGVLGSEDSGEGPLVLPG